MLIITIITFIISTLVLNFAYLPLYNFTVDYSFFKTKPVNAISEEVDLVTLEIDENEAIQDIQLASIDNVVNEISEKAQEIKSVSVPILKKVYLTGKLPVNQDKPQAPQILPDAGEISILAEDVAVLDTESDAFIYGKNINRVTPIASITKLMTALVFLDNNPDWEKEYEITREDRREGGRIYLYLGEKVTVENLFNMSLVASANTATAALVSSTGLSENEFVEKMNAKAVEMGLEKTFFEDTVGLSNNNVSTAKEVAILVKNALTNKDIRQVSLKTDYEFTTINGKDKKVTSTDYLLDNFSLDNISIIGGKTGYTDLAGYCFVGEFIDDNGNEIVSVILDAPDLNSRFMETQKLVDWIYKNFQF